VIGAAAPSSTRAPPKKSSPNPKSFTGQYLKPKLMGVAPIAAAG